MIKKQQKGAALLLSIILVLSVALIIGLGLSFLSFNSLVNAQHKIKSTQSYYAAEAGLEDSLLRLKNGLNYLDFNTLAVGDSTTNIEISELIGGSRTIIAMADTDSRIRKLSVILTINTDQVSFFYGAQAGDGGILMGNNSRIEGNVFSNGSVVANVGGSGDVTDTVTVAGNGNKIDDINIGGDAYVHTCTDSNITGDLNYVSGGSIQNCTYGALVDIGPNEILPADLPISPEKIVEWKNDAIAVGTFSGDYVLNGGETESMGPIQITGNMNLDNNSTINITGLIYVQGDLIVDNNSILELNSNYGALSGVIVVDGRITIQNGAVLQGSGAEGSYLLLLSTNNSTDPDAPAIDVRNNAAGAIFYASNGLIHLKNNINIREATGYMLSLDNNAVVNYESGLQNANFTSGPGGSWQIENWHEVE